MAQEKATYEAVEEFYSIANNIIRANPEQFEGKPVEKIRVYTTDKERQNRKKDMYKISSVKEPISLDCKYIWYVIVYKAEWEEMDIRHKQMLVARILRAIPSVQDEEGDILRPDLKDYELMIETFGPNYLEKDDIPDIVKDKINWKME